MMRLFPNGFGGFDAVDTEGGLGDGLRLVGGLFKFILLLCAVLMPVFIAKNLPGDLRTLWEADWFDWPALWAQTDSIVQFLPIWEIALALGLGTAFWRHSAAAGYLVMAAVGYLGCLFLNGDTLLRGLALDSLGAWLQLPFLAVLCPLISVAAALPPLLLVSAPYAGVSLLVGLFRRLRRRRRPGPAAQKPDPPTEWLED